MCASSWSLSIRPLIQAGTSTNINSRCSTTRKASLTSSDVMDKLWISAITKSKRTAAKLDVGLYCSSFVWLFLYSLATILQRRRQFPSRNLQSFTIVVSTSCSGSTEKGSSVHGSMTFKSYSFLISSSAASLSKIATCSSESCGGPSSSPFCSSVSSLSSSKSIG